MLADEACLKCRAGRCLLSMQTSGCQQSQHPSTLLLHQCKALTFLNRINKRCRHVVVKLGKVGVGLIQVDIGLVVGSRIADRDVIRSLRNQGNAPPSALLPGNWSKYQYQLPGPATKKSTSCPLLQTRPLQPDPVILLCNSPPPSIRLPPRYCNQAQLRPISFSISPYNARPSAKCSVDILSHKMAATRALETGLQRMSITDENDPGEAGRIYQKSKVSSNSHSPLRFPF